MDNLITKHFGNVRRNLSDLNYFKNVSLNNKQDNKGKSDSDLMILPRKSIFLVNMLIFFLEKFIKQLKLFVLFRHIVR